MLALDLFSSAAGGWSLGLHRAGFKTVAACELIEWRRILYAENNPGVLLYDDVRDLTAARLVRDLGLLPDIVVGSPPCQDISSANTKGKGVEGERSGLFFEAVRLIGEIRPRWFALENSANLRTRGADAVLDALEALGYSCWPCVVRAGDIGANHERARSWLIGCDLEQVTDPHGNGWAAQRCGGRSGLDLSVQDDPRDAEEDGRRSGLSRGHSRSVGGAEQSACWDASHANDEGQSRGAVDAEVGELQGLGGDRERNTPHPDQARQAHGCMVSGLRQAEIADDGRGAGRSADGPGGGQMDLCPPDRGDADRSRPVWSLANLAHHLRVDDGLPPWVAGTRVAIGGPRGTAAASLLVEAFGDSVVPQIPEAIGRAILRTEAALSAIYASPASTLEQAA